MSEELIKKIEAVEERIVAYGNQGFNSEEVCEILSEIKAIKDEVEGLEEENATYRGLMHHAGIEY